MKINATYLKKIIFKGKRQQSLSSLKWYRCGMNPDQVLDEFHALDSTNGSGSKSSEKGN